jgi:hypothetical protein
MIPTTVYKYLRVDRNTLSLLIFHELYFSNPVKDFNDPFDFRIRADFTQLFEEVAKDEQRDPKKPRQLGLGGDLSSMESSEFVGLNSSMNKLFFDKIGVCCFSSKNDDILMFSHYADQHRGICLGFSSSILEQNFSRPEKSNKFQKVEYVSEFPDLKLGSSNMHEITRLYSMKSKQWEYEEEYRLLVHDGRGSREFPKNALREVVFGCATPASDKRLIRRVIDLQKTSVLFLQARKARNRFELELARA